ncbi:LysR substrate-binding domain-containing protein [Alisedimentitalea sp. MJ-SS2]|uniref:LysR substrate-binding domain-containing protein n=1 Tax=Aliisedimentitalea sp. MJ-SS2 TaxID=3049795 RepID=UPI0029060010|nr:LysR substrate-binding domain-containing protein [Alisedimentitalea sp. MJ-SS2]MDU8927299.1 LysR substrate-binding domain-containing protein [Alisedimentitalea sp. MJ-SS2]
MSLRFRQLQAFHAVIETGTVTGAAEHLGISQPGISNLLSQLERQTQLKLFSRTKGRLHPTPEAGVLFQEIDTVVRGLDHVAQAVTDLQNQKAGQLQVVAPHALSIGFMPGEIARFAESRPNLSISYQAQYSARIQEWVQAGLFEIGICEEPVLGGVFDAQHFRFECQCALPEDSPLAEHAVLTPELLDGYPFVVMGPEHMTYRRTRDAFEQAGARWNTRVHTHLHQNTLSFVKHGFGAALVDPFTIGFDYEGGFVTRRFAPQVTLDLSIITAKHRPMTAVGQEFLAELTASVAEYAV